MMTTLRHNCFKNPSRRCIDVRITGIVQGVGFRPFVYQQAVSLNLTGRVSNTAQGVHILAEGSATSLSEFVRALNDNAPPLAHIKNIFQQEVPLKDFTDFSIAESRESLNRKALISPDVSVCEDCVRELFDPADRRHLYPFINCTNCGPRYTIISDIPYDRPKTSMGDFQMCPDCQKEYDDPMDRRFHAQPNACATCGPHLFLLDENGRPLDAPNPINETVERLKQGQIVAVKGLGGFHLACDALNGAVVAKLRNRKHREEKPLAVMAKHLDRIRNFAHVDEKEALLLTSLKRPIVLLHKKGDGVLPENLAPNNSRIGCMLPYTPLHFLLMKHFNGVLVMTSANVSEEPICIDNDEASARLAGIADAFLMHNRDIYLRSDDSVVRNLTIQTADGTENVSQVFRRSRGYVPVPIFLKRDYPETLALGGELKNTICLLRENEAFLSQHIGDLENRETLEFFKQTIFHLKRVLEITPRIIAHDLHPDYMSTAFAHELKKESPDLVVVGVQHHHAHIVAAMAENGIDGEVIGLAFDGTGYGTDGDIWGGEVFIADEKQFIRVAHLDEVPMPGGAKAIKEPWRMATAYLYKTFGPSFPLPPFFEACDVPDEKGRNVLIQMMEKEINSPYTSSMGRLFDAVSAMCDIRRVVRFEGQAAMELEACSVNERVKPYPYAWDSHGTGTDGPIVIQTAPMIKAIVSDVLNGSPPGVVGARFHETLISIFTELVGDIRRKTGLNRVVMSGGVFQNAVLLEGLVKRLSIAGLKIFIHKHTPANDGGLALGQAVVAAENRM